MVETDPAAFAPPGNDVPTDDEDARKNRRRALRIHDEIVDRAGDGASQEIRVQPYIAVEDFAHGP